MPEPLRTLIVGHSCAEAELWVQELRRSGYAPEWERVETEADYLSQLAHGPDLVLSAYQLPHFGGLRALELLRRGAQPVPFILLSEVPGEALAVAAMKLGATDYLLKEHWARLGAAVGEALVLVRPRRERNQTEAWLRETITSLALAQEVGNFGSWEIDLGHSADRNRNPLRWSEQCFRIFGFAPGEVEVTNDLFFSLVHPDDRKAVWAAVSAAIETRERYLVDHRIVLRSGQVRHVREAGQVFFDELTGRPLRIVGSVHDITESRAAVEALRESERFVRAALDGLTAHIAILDEQGVILAVNEAWRAFAVANDLAWERGGEGVNYLAVCDQVRGAGAGDAQAVAAAIRDLLEGRRTGYEAEYPCHSPTERRWFLIRVTLFPGAGPRRVVVAHENITRRRLQEEELRASEERFRQVVETMREVFWMRDVLQDRMIYVSPGYEKIWGYPPARLYNSPTHWAECMHPADRERVVPTAREKQLAGTYDETFRIVRPDGGQRWIRARAFPVHNADGVVYRVAGVAEDITESKLAELRLQLQYAVTAILAEAAAPAELNLKILETLCRGLQWDIAALWMVDRSARVLRCAEVWHPPSAEFQEFAEASRTMTFALGDGLPGCVWKSGQPEWSADVTHDVRMRRSEQVSRLHLNGWLGFPIRMRQETLGVVEFFSAKMQAPDQEMLETLGALGSQIGVFIERRQLAEQFQQMQKLEALGTLAGGIAHDFNNILGAIIGYAELAKIQVGEDAAANEFLDAVLDGSRRAVELVRQILAFSRQESQKRMLVQLRHVVTAPLKLLRATIPPDIEFDLAMEHSLPPVLADPMQVHQMLMNLGNNAWYAMKDGPGRLTVRLENFFADAKLASAHPGLRAGPYVRLSVTDTGCGMDAATMERIFDPFFTTKPPGEGSGLGLAVVHGLMQAHDGAVTVDSQLGQGTTFHLYFPVHDLEVASPSQTADTVPKGHGERILLVDDEKPLTLLGQSALKDLGYAVTAASNAMEALELLRDNPDAFDLVITDLTMPGLTGFDFARQLLKAKPGLPIILMTGYSASLTAERVRALGLRELLLKPFSLASLGLAVHRALQEDISI